MKKKLFTAMIMLALVATASAQDKSAPEKRTFKERSEVVADSIRSKVPRFGKRVAEKSAVIVDSIGSKGTRVGRKAKVVGDTVAVRSKKAWKVMKGE